MFLKSDDNNFCALRTWNQKAESGFMKGVEDAYQNLADQIASGQIVRRLKRDETQVITDMYVLWHCRWHWNKNPIGDQALRGVLGLPTNTPKMNRNCWRKAASQQLGQT